MALDRFCPPSGFCTLKELSLAVFEREVSSKQLVEVCLGRIQDALPESSSSFVQLYSDEALITAAALDDTLQRSTASRLPLMGVPVAVKDLLDVAGKPTWVGKPPVEGHAVASEDALVVERLRSAGAVLLGKTQLTELAAVGHGYNKHYNTLTSPFCRSSCGDGCIPGGSSSGSGVAVADGLVPVALGTDTGGSIRIPAAWCGVVGFKPSFGRVPLTGCLPLCDCSLDTIGPLGRCVEDCAVVFRVLAGIAEPSASPIKHDVATMKFLVPTFCLDDLDKQVHDSFEDAISALERAGAHVQRLDIPMLRELPNLMLSTFLAEIAANHQDLLADEHCKNMDPVVRDRILQGTKISAPEYLRAQKRRKILCSQMDETSKLYDAILMPTVKRIPILVSEAQSSKEAIQNAADKCNINTRLGNMLGRCAASLPCHRSEFPVSITVMGEAGGDERCLEVSAAVEAVLKGAGLGAWAAQKTRKLDTAWPTRRASEEAADN